MRDLDSHFNLFVSIDPAVQSADATGIGISLQGFDGAEVIFLTGADVAGTHAPEVQESDSLGSGYTTVAAGDLVGTALPANMGADAVHKIGYIGKKEFIRAFVTTSGASLLYGAMIMRGRAAQTPVA